MSAESLNEIARELRQYTHTDDFQLVEEYLERNDAYLLPNLYCELTFISFHMAEGDSDISSERVEDFRVRLEELFYAEMPLDYMRVFQKMIDLYANEGVMSIITVIHEKYDQYLAGY